MIPAICMRKKNRRMNRLIARSKAVTADMEAVLAELESEIEPFRAPKDHE